MCPNFGMPEKLTFHLEQMENLLFLGVPTLKHIMIVTSRYLECWYLKVSSYIKNYGLD